MQWRVIVHAPSPHRKRSFWFPMGRHEKHSSLNYLFENELGFDWLSVLKRIDPRD